MLSKIFKVLISFFLILLISFSFVRLIPGDPVQNIIGERGASEERIAEIKENLGLNRSLIEQLSLFTANALKGNFGESIISKQSVLTEFKILFPATLELTFAALFWSIPIGILLGILAASYRNSALDYTVISLSTIGFAMPIFWWGLVIIFFFAVQLGMFPVSGRIEAIYDVPVITGFYLIDAMKSLDSGAWRSVIRHLVLPAFTLGTISLALIVRVTRSAFIDIAKEDFIRTAKSKGLSQFQIIFKHILKNALPTILTAMGLSLGQLLTGAIITETLFSWPGIGRWIVNAIMARDYPVVQAGLFYCMMIIILINFLTDLSVRWVNPKLRDQLRVQP